MSQIGSFALLLALALSTYSFLAGVLALARPGPGSERLGETARRAGIATFAVVFLAALILVISAFQDDFSIAYIYHHSNRELPGALQVCHAVVGAGRLAAVLVVVAGGLRIGAAAAPQNRCPAFCLCLGHHCRGADFLPAAAEFRRPSVCPHDGQNSRRRRRPEPAAAVSGDGDPSADAVSGIRGLHRALCLRAGRADHAISRREVDPHHPPLDHGDLGLPDLRNFSRRALGVFSSGLGRLLGMGPGGECVADAVADRYRVSAFGDDAGKARHAEDVEHVADLRHLLAGDSGNVPHPQRNHQLGACFRAVVHRRMVQVVSADHVCRRLPFSFS